RACGSGRCEPVWPNDLMFYVVAHHDAGWAEFDRDPVTDETTGMPYNLVETPAKYLTVTSRRSPDFNERHHPYCGLMSSMHSWGLYNGRYGLSKLVLIDKIPPIDRPLAERMLASGSTLTLVSRVSQRRGRGGDLRSRRRVLDRRLSRRRND